MVDGRSETIVIVASIFLAIPLPAVALRCYVRHRIANAFGWDDGLMVVAMIFDIVFGVCGILGGIYGIGKQTAYFADKPDDFRQAMLLWWLGQAFYLLASLVAKVSIVLSMLRITFVTVHRAVLCITAGLTVVVHLLMFFFTLFQCSPVSYFWDRMNIAGKCLDFSIIIPVAYSYSAVAALCDFTIGLLPVVILWKLQMNRRTKLSLAGIFGMGCIAGMAVIIRIPYLHRYEDMDFLYETVNLSIWSNVEAGVGITAGSLTTIRPLLRALRGRFPRLRSGRSVSGSNMPDVEVCLPLKTRPQHLSTIQSSHVDDGPEESSSQGHVEGYHRMMTAIGVSRNRNHVTSSGKSAVSQGSMDEGSIQG